MAGRMDGPQLQIADMDAVAVADAQSDNLRRRPLAHDRETAGARLQRAEAGDVIRMEMGVDGHHQRQVQFPQQLDVAFGLFEHGIDETGFAAIGDEIGIGTGGAVEELTEDHKFATSLGCAQQIPLSPWGRGDKKCECTPVSSC